MFILTLTWGQILKLTLLCQSWHIYMRFNERNTMVSNVLLYLSYIRSYLGKRALTKMTHFTVDL